MHTTVPARDGRFAGCCPVPAPDRGAPHVVVWTADGPRSDADRMFVPAQLAPEEAIRLGTALLAAGKEVAPKELDHRIGELPLSTREPDDDD
jgi:hypothetical protein